MKLQGFTDPRQFAADYSQFATDDYFIFHDLVSKNRVVWDKALPMCDITG